MKSRSLFSGLLVVALACWVGLATGQELTTGSISGTVTDPTGKLLVGVTVTLSSAQGPRTATTDANGNFRFQFLIAGTYGLNATLRGYTPVEQGGIELHLGQNVRAELVLTPGVTQEISVYGAPPVVDLTSTTTGTTITSSMMASLPIGRSFANTLDLAPGVVFSGIDKSNPSIGGASGLENTYIIDGMNIGNTGYGSAGSYSIVFGSLGTGVNYDYIQEIQVKTGGYEPEYGAALGGYINLVTKSGGNELHGSIFSYQSLRGLQNNRVTDGRLNAPDQPLQFSSHDYGFEAGGPVVKDKAFWFAAFDPTFTIRRQETPLATRNALGFDHIVDVKRNIYDYAANIKWLVTPNHTLSVSAFGDPSVGANGPQRATITSGSSSPLQLADITQRFSRITYGGNNVVGHWDGQLMNNWFIEGMVGYHQDQFKEDPQFQIPQGVDRRPQTTGQPALQLGGVGFFEHSKSWNTDYNLKFSNYLQGSTGQHRLRYGIEYQNIGYEENPNYSGQPGLHIQLTPGDPASEVVSTTGYQWDIDADATRLRINRIRFGPLGASTSERYYAGFLSDTWTPSDLLSVMAGIRYEQERLVGTITDFTWKNNWAPRFHATVDPTRDNKTKIWGSWGRFFGKVPNDLAVRALSAEVTAVVDYAIPPAGFNFNDPVALQNYLTPAHQIGTPIVFGNTPEQIDPNSKLTYEDEYTVGVQREVRPFTSVSLNYLHRKLGRTLEDVQGTSYSAILGGADFGNYLITNPGPGNNNPTPSRKYDAITFQIEKRLRDNWQAQASYTWSKLKGNYEGYYRRDNGQSDPFITSAFDFPYLLDPDVWGFSSADGFLPNDRRHVINLFGSYRFENKLTVGMDVRAASGMPITKLGYNQVYGNTGEIVLEPRGASGRMPWTANIGLHFDYPFDLGVQGRKLEVAVDVLNILDQQKGVDFSPNFEDGGNVNPPPSVVAAGIAPCPNCIEPDFGKPILYQDPRTVILSARLRF